MEASAPTLILAPIRGVTDAVYRDAFARCFGGFDRAVAPFILLRQGQTLRPGEVRQAALENNRSLRTIPQVLTNHAPTFSAALRTLHDGGHDEVNWNLGCPYPMVAGRGRGAGLLPFPDRIDALLSEVLAASPVRLSVKMRLGYKNPDEYRAVLEVLNRHPLAEVTLHPRTASQMYEGAVDAARAGDALAACRHPFVFNGGITCPVEFYERHRQLPGAAAWMLGRGALSCPFLPSLLKGVLPPPPETLRQRLRAFHDLLLDGYSRWLSGPGHLRDRMQEQWAYMAQAFADPRRLFKRIRRSGPGTYADTVDWAFDQPLADIPTVASGEAGGQTAVC